MSIKQQDFHSAFRRGSDTGTVQRKFCTKVTAALCVTSRLGHLASRTCQLMVHDVTEQSPRMSRLWTLLLILGLASAQVPRNEAGLEANLPQATPRCVSYDSEIEHYRCF